MNKSQSILAPRFLRIRDVVVRTGLSRSRIYSLEAEGGFPRRRQLSERAVAWHENEVAAWIESRPLARGAVVGDETPDELTMNRSDAAFT